MAMSGGSQQTSWAARAEHQLADAGYRRGGARSAVIELLDGQHCALSAGEIEQALKERGTAIGRASVYRVLEQLEDLRLLQRVSVGQGLARFEPVREEGHHHHMVCDRCGDVFPFEDPELERSIRRLSGRVKFTVEEHEVVLHGSCADCRR
jgi:Fur family transcriptional regulator, ferric uptake regulator